VIYVLISLIIVITLLKNISKSGITFNWCLKDAAQALEKSSFLLVKEDISRITPLKSNFSSRICNTLSLLIKS